MHKVLDKLTSGGEASRLRWPPPPPPSDHYTTVIPTKLFRVGERNFLLYAQKPVVPRDRHSLTDIKDPFGGQFGRKAHLEGRQAVESVNNESWVVFNLRYVHQIAGVGVAVWFG